MPIFLKHFLIIVRITNNNFTFKDKDERYFFVFFNSSKAVEAANVRFKMLDIIEDQFGIVVSKKSILPMKLWCNENKLIINEL